MSDDSLYRTTVSHRSMPRPQTALQRSESDFQNKGFLPSNVFCISFNFLWNFYFERTLVENCIAQLLIRSQISHLSLLTGELCHSDSSLAERSRKPLPQVTSHLSWSHVVDATRVFEGNQTQTSIISSCVSMVTTRCGSVTQVFVSIVTGVFSSLSLHQDVRVTSQRSPLQDR